RSVGAIRYVRVSASLGRSATGGLRRRHIESQLSCCRPPPVLADAPFGSWLRPARTGVLLSLGALRSLASLTRASSPAAAGARSAGRRRSAFPCTASPPALRAP